MRSANIVSPLFFVAAAASFFQGVDGFQVSSISTGTRLSGLPLSSLRTPPRQSSRLYGATEDDNQWDESPNDPKEDLGFFDSIKSWFRSEEGREDVRTYSTSLALALLLRLLVIEPRYIPSLSMYPTFEVGDQLAVEKITKRIRPLERNEVVVFNPPIAFRQVLEGSYPGTATETAQKAREALIKRIVAVAGDKVKVTGGRLYINDIKQDEPFTAENAAYEFGPVVVPTGKVLVLGDNRNHSLDGHIWGFLPEGNVIGRAVFIYWPPWRVGNEGMY